MQQLADAPLQLGRLPAIATRCACWLAQLGLPLELHELSVVDRSNRAEVLGDLNPAVRVPTLVLDDGRPVAESNAILWYLGDGTAYVPDDRYERAQVLQWQFFEQYSTSPRSRSCASCSPTPARPRSTPTGSASRRESGYTALDAMERHLDGRAFLVGERYTIADISLYAYTHVAHEGGFDLEPYPAIRAWLGRVAAQPGHVTIDA